MKLINEKVNAAHYYSVGYDILKKQYVLSITITYVSWYNRYYRISAQEYAWFDSDPQRLDELARACCDSGPAHPRFLFSERYEENVTAEQADRFRTRMQRSS